MQCLGQFRLGHAPLLPGFGQETTQLSLPLGVNAFRHRSGARPSGFGSTANSDLGLSQIGIICCLVDGGRFVTANIKWWGFLSLLWLAGVLLLAVAEGRSHGGVSNLEWSMVAAAVIFPPAGLWIVIKGIVAVASMRAPYRAQLLITCTAVALLAVVGQLFFRYQTFNVGNGKIMQVDRLTQQVRTCVANHRCSSWRD
jgi:hypothetical protein